MRLLPGDKHTYRQHFHRPVGLGFGELPRDAAFDRGHFCPNVLHRNTWLYAHHGKESASRAKCLLLRLERERKPNLYTNRKSELPTGDAYNVVLLAVQQHGFADDGGIAGESALPQPVAQNHLLVVAELLFLHPKGSANRGLNPDGVEKIRGDERANKSFRLAGARQIHAVVLPYRDFFIRMALRFPVEIIGRGHRAKVHGLSGRKAEQHHQAIKIGQGHRLAQESDGHAEYRRVGSNAQSQGNHSQRSESGVLQQHAETGAQVLEVAVHNSPRRSFVEDTYDDPRPNVSLLMRQLPEERGLVPTWTGWPSEDTRRNP